jgi:hypothetical protein
VLLLLNSHGNAHPRHRAAPDAGRDEHYIHLPHRVPEADERL